LALEISCHSEIITKGSPPKCFEAYGVVFFLLVRGTGSHNDPLLIVKKMVEETRATSTTQCTLGTTQDGGQELTKRPLNNVSVHI